MPSHASSPDHACSRAKTAVVFRFVVSCSKRQKCPTLGPGNRVCGLIQTSRAACYAINHLKLCKIYWWRSRPHYYSWYQLCDVWVARQGMMTITATATCALLRLFALQSRSLADVPRRRSHSTEVQLQPHRQVAGFKSKKKAEYYLGLKESKDSHRKPHVFNGLPEKLVYTSGSLPILIRELVCFSEYSSTRSAFWLCRTAGTGTGGTHTPAPPRSAVAVNTCAAPLYHGRPCLQAIDRRVIHCSIRSIVPMKSYLARLGRS